MTNREFRLWIRGYQELSGNTSFDARQIHIIKNHANLVKAVVGHLDDDIQAFIHSLESLRAEFE